MNTCSPPGVIAVFAPQRTPPVPVQSLVIIGVDDGVFALRERYSAKGIAEAYPAIQKGKPYKGAVKPIGNVERNPDDPLRVLASAKHEFPA
ncbi:MAG: hypothetical protein ACYSUP_02690 [Planctomycetota bacterium]